MFTDRVLVHGRPTGWTADVACVTCRKPYTVQIDESGWFGFDCCGQWQTAGLDWRSVAAQVGEYDEAERCLTYAAKFDAEMAVRRANGDFLSW